MLHTIIGVPKGHVPAVLVAAGGLLGGLVYVLPEVELLHGVDLGARGKHEILIAYLTITIHIKLIEKLLKLLFCEVFEAPMMEMLS